MTRNRIITAHGKLVPYRYGAGYTVHPVRGGNLRAQKIGKGVVRTKKEGLQALAELANDNS